MPAPDNGFVLGVDAGGTSTRAIAIGLDGVRLGSGEAAGGNPNSHPPARAAAHVAEAVTVALSNLDPAAARAGVVGLAGSSKLSDPEVAALFEKAWHRTGARCPMTVLSDSEVAFAAATEAPHGTALVAGTGSVAARIRDHRTVATAGGYGWLLGDEGSAFWLGREAVRATLRMLERGEGRGGLAGAVLSAAGVATTPGERAAAKLITAVNAAAPIRLARFAPLVSRAASEGDPAATAILHAACDTLVRLAMQAREPAERTPVVLIGGLVEPGGPLTERLRTALGRACAAEVRIAEGERAGALGAARLALIEFDHTVTRNAD